MNYNFGRNYRFELHFCTLMGIVEGLEWFWEHMVHRYYCKYCNLDHRHLCGWHLGILMDIVGVLGWFWVVDCIVEYILHKDQYRHYKYGHNSQFS